MAPDLPTALVASAGPDVDLPAGVMPDEAGAEAEAVPVGPESISQDAPHRFGKWLVALVAAVIVIVIVAVIRLSVPNPDSGSLTPTTVNSETSTTIAVSSTALASFNSASTPLLAANSTMTQELSGATAPTVAALAADVTPYVTALKTYDFDLSSISWPEALQVPSEAMVARSEGLISFLSSISSVNSGTLNAWMSRFHVLAASAQAATNTVRSDIGLPPTSSYP